MTPPGEEPDPRLGVQLGAYTLVAHVADGSTGAVYEARKAESRERVAIKVLHADVAEDDIAVERFNREYETAAMFEHPHIVKVLDFGETGDGSRFLTMEYLLGQELGHRLRTEGAQPPARTLRMLAQVAEALEHAHSFGVIHRDLKPDNIYLCASDQGDDVRLLDFGSVKLQLEMGPKLTAFGTTLGSPFYMSPEQAKGLADVDTRTDVFAMGAILYEALTGKIAFDGKSVAEILTKIVKHDPAPPSSVDPRLPAAIDAVVLRALAKDKNERFETPTALVDAALSAFGVAGGCARWASESQSALEAALAASAPTASPAPPASPPIESAPLAAPPASRPPLLLFAGLGALAFLAASCALAFALWL